MAARGHEQQHEAVGFLARHDVSQPNNLEARQEN